MLICIDGLVLKDAYLLVKFVLTPLVISHLLLFPGKAAGVLFEDDGDGYEYAKGDFLLTYYAAELDSSVVTVKVSKTEGLRKRPKRVLHVHLLLGGGAMVCIFSGHA